MTLNEWIDSIGGVTKAALTLRMNTRTVRSWYYGKRQPRAAQAAHIIKVADGRLDCNSIYGPFVAAAVLEQAA